MPIRTNDAGKGLEWFTGGWKLFVKSPGMWMVMTVVFALIAIVLSLIPFIGALALSLIGPALGAGMLSAAKTLDDGGEIDVSYLFQGLRDAERRGSLLVLGVMLLGVEILVGLVIGAGMMSGPMMGGMGDGLPSPMQFASGGLFGLLISLVIMVLVAMAFCYAIPLVMFKGDAPIAAIQASFNAGVKNILPLSVAGIIYIVLAIIAAIPFGLGFLALIPVTVCAVYLSYKSVFE